MTIATCILSKNQSKSKEHNEQKACVKRLWSQLKKASAEYPQTFIDLYF